MVLKVCCRGVGEIGWWRRWEVIQGWDMKDDSVKKLVRELKAWWRRKTAFAAVIGFKSGSRGVHMAAQE